MTMRARQLLGSAVFPPDVLKVLFAAFDDAWDEVAGDVSSRAAAVDAARLRLATIVLSLAKSGPIEHGRIKDAAAEEFRRRHIP
jgi:hypothetical protein